MILPEVRFLGVSVRAIGFSVGSTIAVIQTLASPSPPGRAIGAESFHGQSLSFGIGPGRRLLAPPASAGLAHSRKIYNTINRTMGIGAQRRLPFALMSFE
jgi:hypothetical protein